jgi:hypothetical protein
MSKKTIKSHTFDFKTLNFSQKMTKMTKTTANVAEVRKILSTAFRRNEPLRRS